MANNTIYPYGTGGQTPAGIPIVNDMFTGGADKALSAEMGKFIGQRIPIDIDEVGLFVVDSQLNIVIKYDDNGFDVARLSEHFLSMIGGSSNTGMPNVIEEGFFFVDSKLNIGFAIEPNGAHAVNIPEYEIINL